LCIALQRSPCGAFRRCTEAPSGNSESAHEPPAPALIAMRRSRGHIANTMQSVRPSSPRAGRSRPGSLAIAWMARPCAPAQGQCPDSPAFPTDPSSNKAGGTGTLPLAPRLSVLKTAQEVAMTNRNRDEGAALDHLVERQRIDRPQGAGIRQALWSCAVAAA